MADLAEVIDPRRALIRRQLEAGAASAAQTPAPAQAAAGPTSLSKPITPQDMAARQAQMQQLAAILRARQALPQ